MFVVALYLANFLRAFPGDQVDCLVVQDVSLESGQAGSISGQLLDIGLWVNTARHGLAGGRLRQVLIGDLYFFLFSDPA